MVCLASGTYARLLFAFLLDALLLHGCPAGPAQTRFLSVRPTAASASPAQVRLPGRVQGCRQQLAVARP